MFWIMFTTIKTGVNVIFRLMPALRFNHGMCHGSKFLIVHENNRSLPNIAAFNVSYRTGIRIKFPEFSQALVFIRS